MYVQKKRIEIQTKSTLSYALIYTQTINDYARELKSPIEWARARVYCINASAFSQTYDYVAMWKICAEKDRQKWKKKKNEKKQKVKVRFGFRVSSNSAHHQCVIMNQQ